jgi:uncharacterized LabA/DUF88 family protein
VHVQIISERPQSRAFYFVVKMNKKVAFFVDGGYFMSRIKFYYRKFYSTSGVVLTPQHVVELLYFLIRSHQTNLHRDELYRIYYYDAPPYSEQMREPVPRELGQGLSTKSFKNSPNTIIQLDLHERLKNCRKLALRMGKLSNAKDWILKQDIQKKLLSGEIQVVDLKPDNFKLDVKQKGVDTRIGIDIATLTLSKFADTIVLFASDADFVPAATLARTHGVDVMLDPLYGNVDQELSLHVDGKKSFDIVSALGRIMSVKPNPKPQWWNDR